ncbi:unnamed protein product, partial [Mesorhabditis belari]|uniref:Uncharacterized protein n=1 Tax=Mesorhabditis belari TaxID=2138241 RepID=A0AAF3J951_9BILA
MPNVSVFSTIDHQQYTDEPIDVITSPRLPFNSRHITFIIFSIDSLDVSHSDTKWDNAYSKQSPPSIRSETTESFIVGKSS